MRKFASVLFVVTSLIAGSGAPAYACGFFDFACNTAKNKAQKTQAVIAVIDAGRASGWEDVQNQFSSKELARLRSIGIDPGNGSLIGALKDVNTEHFADLKDEEWNGVVELIGADEYIDQQVAKSKLGVDDLERMQGRLRDLQEKALEDGVDLTDEGTVLLEKIADERAALMGRIDELDSGVELSVLSGALRTSGMTLDAAGVAVAQDVMDGGDFETMVSQAAAAAGVSADEARTVLQQAVSFGVSEISHQSLQATDAVAEAGNQAAAQGDYASAYAADAAARAQAASDRAKEVAALQAAGLTAEAEKVAQIAEQEAQHAAEAAATAAQYATQQAQAAAEHAAQQAAQNAAIAASNAAAAAAKADFISQAIADGASQSEAEALAAQAGH